MGTIVLLATPVKSGTVAATRHAYQIPQSRQPAPGPPARAMRRSSVTKAARVLACIRTRSGRGARRAGCATTGSTTAATGATGWATSSASSPRPSPRCPPAIRMRGPSRGRAARRRRPPSPRRPPASTCWPTSPRSPRSRAAWTRPSTRRAAGSASRPAPRWSGSGSAARAASSPARRTWRGPGSPAPPQHPARSRACSRWPSRPPSPSTRAPATRPPAPILGMGTDELVVRDPRRRGIPGACSCSRARWSWAPTTAAGSHGDRPDAGRPGPRRRRRRAGREPPPPLRGAAPRRDRPRVAAGRRRRRPRPHRPCPGAVRRRPGGGRSSATPRAASRRRAAPGSPRRSSAPPATWSRRDSASATSRRAGPSPARPRRAPVVQPGPRGRHPGGRREPAAGAARRRPRRSTGCSTSPTTGRTAGARSTSTPPRRSRATRRSPSARRARSGAWPPGRPSSSRSSASARASSGLTDVHEIGNAIATELRQLIDYDNVRVYRVHEQRAGPGRHPGPRRRLRSETPEMLSVAVGEGITGWVARFRVPQLVDDTRQRPARDHDPGHRRRTWTSRCCWRRWSTRASAWACVVLVEAGPPPVHRGRPAAAGHLRVVRGPGHGQRGRHGPAARAVERARAPAAGPARAPADHGVHPHDAGPARRAGADHGPARLPDPVRQHRHRGRRPPDGPAPAAHGTRRPRRGLPGPLGARRDRHRDVGRGAQRAGADRGRARRPARQPLPGDGRHRRQPDRRPAASVPRARWAC